MSACHPPTSDHQMISPHPHPSWWLWISYFLCTADGSLTFNVRTFLPRRAFPPWPPTRLWLWGPGGGTDWLVSCCSPGFRLAPSSGPISREPRQSGSHGTRTGHTARAFDVLAERAVHIPKGPRCRGGEHVCGLGSTLTASHVLHLMHAPGAAPRERTPTTTPDRNDHHPELPRPVEHLS